MFAMKLDIKSYSKHNTDIKKSLI